MTDGPDLDKLAEDTHAAVADVLHRHGAGMMIKFVAVAEIMDDETERNLWMLTSPGTYEWETKGFLLHALDVEQRSVTEE